MTGSAPRHGWHPPEIGYYYLYNLLECEFPLYISGCRNVLSKSFVAALGVDVYDERHKEWMVTDPLDCGWWTKAKQVNRKYELDRRLLVRLCIARTKTGGAMLAIRTQDSPMSRYDDAILLSRPGPNCSCSVVRWVVRMSVVGMRTKLRFIIL